MATIRDVASKAGVAPITVSRVINNSGYVSASTRARVEAAIAELQYIRNDLARSLRFKQTNTLALLVSDISNPFWTTVARGVEDAASEQGLNVILCNTDESEQKLNTYLNLVMQKQTDGILLVPVHGQCDAINQIQEQKVPLVIMDRTVATTQADVVRCDSEDGACRLTRLLLSLGHRQITLLNGPPDVSTAIERAAGFRRAFEELGLEINADQIIYSDFSIASGHEMAQRALAVNPPPTALFAANNFIAIGALRAVRAANLQVPGDVAMVAFDDLPFELVNQPFLTVASQPAYEMGRRATELLLERIARTALDGPQNIVLPIEIIVRESSGPPLSTVQNNIRRPIP